MLCMVVVFCVNAYQLRILSGFWQMELQHDNFEAFIVIWLNKMDGCCYDGYIVSYLENLNVATIFIWHAG